MKYLFELFLSILGRNEPRYNKDLNNLYKRMNEDQEFCDDVFFEAWRKDKDNDTFFNIEAEIKNSPNYAKFKKPHPKYVPFSVRNGESYYLHAGKVTGLEDEEAAEIYAAERIKQANALCSLDKTNKEKNLSVQERLDALNALNTRIDKNYYAKYKWQYDLKRKIKQSHLAQDTSSDDDECFPFFSSDPILRRLNPRKKTAREDVLPAPSFKRKI